MFHTIRRRLRSHGQRFKCAETVSTRDPFHFPRICVEKKIRAIAITEWNESNCERKDFPTAY